MIKYKGYSIWCDKDCFGRSVWSFGTLQQNGTMFIHATGYGNCLTAKRAVDAHFGRL